MPSFDMEGPFPFAEQEIDARVDDTFGNYHLGFTAPLNEFRVQYVGRSEELNQRLKKHLPERYAEFRFCYEKNAIATYRKECTDYHHFNPPFNKAHPAKPEGCKDSLRCSCCGE